MVFFNYALRKLNAKIVYYGPGLCGKTTNLQWIHDHYEGGRRGKMLSLATEGDRTIFFDLLPIDIGTIRGMEVTLQLYTVPGQVHYNSTRQLVLKGADGVVFVADSQRAMAQSNVESWQNLKENLLLQGIELASFPHVVQFNKRDLADLLPQEEMNDAINEYDAPIFDAVAVEGIGVQETLVGIVKLVMRALRERYDQTAPGQSAGGPRMPTAAGAPRAPVAPSAPRAPSAPQAPQAPSAPRPPTAAGSGVAPPAAFSRPQAPASPAEPPPKAPAAEESPAAARPAGEEWVTDELDSSDWKRPSRVSAPEDQTLVRRYGEHEEREAEPKPESPLVDEPTAVSGDEGDALEGVTQDVGGASGDREDAMAAFEDFGGREVDAAATVSMPAVDAETGGNAFEPASAFEISDEEVVEEASFEVAEEDPGFEVLDEEDAGPAAFDQLGEEDVPEAFEVEDEPAELEFAVLDEGEEDPALADTVEELPAFDSEPEDRDDTEPRRRSRVGEAFSKVAARFAPRRHDEMEAEESESMEAPASDEQLAEASDRTAPPDVSAEPPDEDESEPFATVEAEVPPAGRGATLAAEQDDDAFLRSLGVEKRARSKTAPPPAESPAAVPVDEEPDEGPRDTVRVAMDQPAARQRSRAPFVVDDSDPFADEAAMTPELMPREGEIVPTSAEIRATDQGNSQLKLRLEGKGAVAEYGQMRELDIEVPVPSGWVGGQKVTLQLRLTLSPREEDE